MPIDIDAEVVANTRLSDDYNVVALTAPGIASLAQPGQFVMIKPARGIDPLLRRPFSIFEILRDEQGAATGVSLLNKRIGVGTGLLYEARPGSRVAVL
jgi:dihydroorotate dehydrogenase electron transfer subunit